MAIRSDQIARGGVNKFLLTAPHEIWLLLAKWLLSRYRQNMRVKNLSKYESPGSKVKERT